MSDAPRDPVHGSYHAFYGVVRTFCGVPLVSSRADVAAADAVVIGAPFDEGVSYRPGTRFGPQAVRTAEDINVTGDRPSMHAGIDALMGITFAYQTYGIAFLSLFPVERLLPASARR